MLFLKEVRWQIPKRKKGKKNHGDSGKANGYTIYGT